MEPLHSRRSTYALLGIGFIVSLLLFTFSAVQQTQDNRTQAAPESTLSLVPSNTDINVGDEVEIKVNVATANNQIAAAEITLAFDTQIFQGISFDRGDFVPNTMISGTINAGVAHIIVGSSPAEPQKGTGALAILKLKALQKTNASNINFVHPTQISAVGETGDVVVSEQNTSIKVQEVLVQTPDTRLYFIPDDIYVEANQKLYLPIIIDTGANLISAADIAIVYDANRFEGLSITSGGFLPVVLNPGSVSLGVAKIVLGAEPQNPKKGNGVLAVLELRTKSIEGTTNISLDGSTQVSSLNSSANVIDSLGAASVQIGQIAQTSYSQSKCTQTPQSPPTPFAYAVSPTKVSLSWSPVGNATHYGIVYGTKLGAYIYGAANVGDVSSYTISQLSPRTTYYFAVFSVNDCGASSYSAPAEATLLSTASNASVSQLPLPVASAQTQGSSVEFEPIDPNSSAYDFLGGGKPQVSPSPLPQIDLSGQEATSGNSSLFDMVSPVTITIVGLVVLLLISIVLLKK